MTDDLIPKSLLEIAKWPVLNTTSTEVISIADRIKLATSMVQPIRGRRPNYGPKPIDLPSTGF
jgi:hypothetical protein